MATAKYWRATLVGYWTTGPWEGEMATCGISGVAVDGGGNFGPVISEPLPSFNASASGAAGSTTDLTYQLGSVGTGIWSEETQIDLALMLRSFGEAVYGQQSNQFKWMEARTAAFDVNNDVINGQSYFSFNTPITGGGSPTGVSPAAAVVASLRSAGRGPANRGRMYIPCHAASLSNYVLSTALQDYFGHATRDLVRAIDGLPGAIWPAVVSTTHMWYSDIIDVRVGDELDFQQRRRRQRKETYKVYPV